MDKRKKYVLISLGVLLLVGVFGFEKPQAQNPKHPDKVEVVNADFSTPGAVSAAQSGSWKVGLTGTPSVNAAQSGAWNVGLTGTPGVNAAQSGSWNVGLTGTPSVNVANLPAPVDVGPRQAIQLAAYGSGMNGAYGSKKFVSPNTSTTPFTVPAGQRLVIQYVSGSVSVPSDKLWAPVEIDLDTFQDGGAGSLCGQALCGITNVLAPPVFAGIYFDKQYLFSHQIMAYSDAGSQVTLEVKMTTIPLSSGNWEFRATLHGYLIDCGGGGCPPR